MRARGGRSFAQLRHATVIAIVLVLGLTSQAASNDVEDDELRVRAIRFEGVESLRESELLDHMITRTRPRLRFWKRRPEWSARTFEEDLVRIEQLYRNHGYYEAVVRGEVDEGLDDRQVVVTVHVEEGEAVRLEAISIELEPGAPIGASDLADSLPIHEGDVFGVDAYQSARAAALAKLAVLGHPDAKLSGGAEVFVASRSARIDWRISPGPLVTFGDVRVEGLDRVDEYIVSREIAVVEGERYSPSALAKTRERLLRLHLFRYVAVTPERPVEAAEGEEKEEEGGEAGGLPERPDAGVAPAAQAAEGAAPPRAEATWPIVVKLEERPPRSIAIGGGWASGLGPRGSIRWSHRNFFGGARRFTVGATASPVEQQASMRLQQPRLFGSRVTLVADSLWLRRSRSSYDWNTIALDVGPRWTLGPRWVLEPSYRFGWTDVSNVTDETNDVLRAQKGSGLLSGVGVSTRRAQLDRATNPRMGTWLELGVRTNLKALGSDFDWMRYSAEARGYLPLGPTVAAFRARYQVIDPLRSTGADEVPLGARLFLGGPHTGRGFPFEKLGPLDAQGEPVGGVTSLLVSAEWRVPVWGPVTLIGFVDAGQVSLEPFGFDASEIGVGTGAGMAFTTPIGPVAFHLGWPVRNLQVSKSLRFAITIGHSF